MCSYEKADQPDSRDLGFYNRDLGNRDENFPISTLQPGYRDENVFDKLASISKLGGQNGIILPCMHFHFKSIRISFISKATRVEKAMIVANDTYLCGVILVLFLEFHPGIRAEISDMNRRQNSSK